MKYKNWDMEKYKEILQKEGFKSVYEWTDKPGVVGNMGCTFVVGEEIEGDS